MTSRYAQICEAWYRRHRTRLDRRDAAFLFVERFVAGLIDFLEIPPERVELAPPDDSVDEAPCTVSAASAPARDGFWCTGLRLTLVSPMPRVPRLSVKLMLHFKEWQGTYLFKLHLDGDAVELRDAPDADLGPGFELIFDELLVWLERARA